MNKQLNKNIVEDKLIELIASECKSEKAITKILTILFKLIIKLLTFKYIKFNLISYNNYENWINTVLATLKQEALTFYKIAMEREF